MWWWDNHWHGLNCLLICDCLWFLKTEEAAEQKSEEQWLGSPLTCKPLCDQLHVEALSIVVPTYYWHIEWVLLSFLCEVWGGGSSNDLSGSPKLLTLLISIIVCILSLINQIISGSQQTDCELMSGQQTVLLALFRLQGLVMGGKRVLMWPVNVKYASNTEND